MSERRYTILPPAPTHPSDTLKWTDIETDKWQCPTDQRRTTPPPRRAVRA